MRSLEIFSTLSITCQIIFDWTLLHKHFWTIPTTSINPFRYILSIPLQNYCCKTLFLWLPIYFTTHTMCDAFDPLMSVNKHQVPKFTITFILYAFIYSDPMMQFKAKYAWPFHAGLFCLIEHTKSISSIKSIYFQGHLWGRSPIIWSSKNTYDRAKFISSIILIEQNFHYNPLWVSSIIL